MHGVNAAGGPTSIPTSLPSAQRWYLVSERWLRHWRQFINKETADGRRVIHPGPIDNACILDAFGAPLPDLKPVADYRGVVRSVRGASGGPHASLLGLCMHVFVSLQVWHWLQDTYGGGPQIERRRINLYED